MEGCNFFYNISTKCPRDSTFSTKQITRNKQQNILLTRPSSPLSKITRLGQKEWTMVCLLLCWSRVEMIWFTLASAPRHNPSYLILAGAPRLEHGTLLCISLQGIVFAAWWRVEDAQGQRGSYFPRGEERIAGYTAAQACLASPGKTSRGV